MSDTQARLNASVDKGEPGGVPPGWLARLRAFTHDPIRQPARRLESAGFLILACVWTVFVFEDGWHAGVSLKYTLLPLIIWAALRYPIHISIVACLAVGALSAGLTVRGSGAIAAASLPAAGQYGALLAFLAVLGMSALFCVGLVARERQARARQQEAKEHMRAIFDGARDAIFIADCQTGLVVEANEQAGRLLNRSRAEILGMHQSDLHPPERRAHYRQRFVSRAEQGEPGHREADVWTSDGRPVPVEISARAVAWGGARVMIGIFRDITARKQLERELRYHSLLLDQISDTIVATDLNGRITYVNEALCRQHDKPRGEMIGAPITILGADPERGATQEEILRATRAAGAWKGRVAWPASARPGTLIDVRATVVRDEAGEPVGLCGIGTDVTDRHRMELILQARLRLIDYSLDHSLEEVLVATLDEVEMITNSRVGFYHFLGADQRTLALQAWSTRTSREMCQAEGKGLHYDVGDAGVWVDCIHQRQPVIHNDYAALAHRKGLPDGHAPVIRELVVPVFRAGLIVAVLGVGNKPSPYTDTDVDTVTRLADFAWEVAERRQAEENLGRSRAELNAIYDHAPVMMCVLDAGRCVRYVNRAFEQFVGVSPGDLRMLRACGVFGCINAWDDPGGCGHGPNCGDCGLRQALVDSLRTGASHTGIEYRTTLLLDTGPRDVVLLGATARIDTSGEPLLLMCLTDITTEKQSERELRQSQERLKALSRQLVDAQEIASRELARELHDRVGQNLTALNLTMTRLLEEVSLSQTPRLAGPLKDSLRLVSETMGHVRDVMSELRPPVLEDYGLAAALRWYGSQFARRAGVDVVVKADGDDRWTPETEIALFRIAQEALTNVARHASAANVAVALGRAGGQLTLVVSDNGVGFDTETPTSAGCWGLVTMRERAESIGGRLEVVSAPGQGTRVEVAVPA
ncbi:MAG: PAS domain S-box protein [Vicinamibacterales bacterium]|nr:PAS domain S-box protein [Vicinamibacterales bacterium]